MTDDDPFADLGETLKDESGGERETDRSRNVSDPTPDDASGDDPSEKRDPMTDSAFTYEEAEQRPFYARAETIDEFDSWLNYELEREISERGYQNIVVREMTDALLRTVVEEDLVDEVAARFDEARENATAELEE